MEQALKERKCKKMQAYKKSSVNLPSLHDKRYVKSFSMEELSSMAREICANKNEQPFYQVGLEYTFERTGSFENICRSSQEKTEHKRNYHSWPKTSLQKKKYRKHMRRISRDGLNSLSSEIIESDQGTSIKPKLARKDGETIRRSDGMKFSSCLFYNASEINRKRDETVNNVKVRQMGNICPQTTGVSGSREQNRSVTKIVTEMPPKSSLSLPVLPSDGKKDDSGLFCHEYWPGSQCLSPFLVVDKVDNNERLKSTESFSCDAKAASCLHELQDQCQETRTDVTPYRCRSKSAPFRDFRAENYLGHVEQNEKNICQGKEQPLKCKLDVVSHEIKANLSDQQKCSEPPNSNRLTNKADSESVAGRTSIGSTVTRLGKSGKKNSSRPLELLTQGSCSAKKIEIEPCFSQKVASLDIGSKVGTSTSQVQTELPSCGSSLHKETDASKLGEKNKASYQLVTNVTEESSESSDSGVGSLKYDIIMKNWNEPVVSGPLFKKRLEILKQWYLQFDDEQKNIILRMLMDNSELPQMHMLSMKMEPILHKDCPTNCQDLLVWLPTSVVHNILEYLDPVCLARASQVNKSWYDMCNDGHLWQHFCRYPDLQLSPAREREQIIKYTESDGNVQWKKVFKERYCLRKNWLNANCNIRTFTGHTQGVSCVQFDETRIVSGSSDKTIKVWDIKSGRTDPVLTLVGHSGTVRCLHLSRNRLVSGSADTTIKVWDLIVGCDWSSAACKVTMTGHLDTVRCLQVDEEKVVSGSYDRTLKMWDIKTGTCKVTFRGHLAAVLCVQFDEEKIVSGSSDRSIKVWNIKTGQCLTTLEGHTDAVTCLQFNFQRIFSGSLDCTLKFWDLCSGECIGTIDWIRSEGHTRVVRCLQADSWKIVSAGDDKTLKIWSLETGQRFVTLRNHTDGVTCLHFNDHMIVSGSYDKTVKLWNFSPDMT